jgi:hypothetical protein
MMARQPHSGEFPMSTDAISPLRQRMIEDMSARKLNPHGSQANSFCRTFRLSIIAVGYIG